MPPDWNASFVEGFASFLWPYVNPAILKTVSVYPALSQMIFQRWHPSNQSFWVMYDDYWPKQSLPLVYQTPSQPCCLEKHLESFLPLIIRLKNLSLSSGTFHQIWKRAIVKPLLKKIGLKNIFKNYRLVSNLNLISKLLESVVLL